MNSKRVPFDRDFIERIEQTTATPFYIYDESGILGAARALKTAFSWNEGFRNYFAVKATPNPNIVKILAGEGFGADCSSLPELLIAKRAGLSGEAIMFTSNDTPECEFAKAAEIGAIINLDDISHIASVEHACGGRLPELMCCRFNPGSVKKGNAIIGDPVEAKYGFTREQMFDGYSILKRKGVKRFGIHTMVASNELNAGYFVETAQIMFELAAEISRKIGITFEFVNLGGGMGIPYEPSRQAVDLEEVSRGIRDACKKYFTAQGLSVPKIYMEMGRMITGPYGWLVSRVRHIKRTYKTYAGLDACMANLMRPAIYGAYHHISVLGGEDSPCDHMYDVTGSLCENNDKFAVNRMLPELHVGDILIIHDAGAHGHAMGFNYNGKLRSAEWLRREDGSAVMIRRPETIEDLFSTILWDKV